MRPVLFLAHSFPPENIIGALRPFRFAKYLPQFGYSPIVVTASRPGPDKPDYVHYVPSPIGFGERIVNRILVFEEHFSWAKSAAREAERLLRETQTRVVFSTSPPFGVHIAARTLKQRCGVKWVADFRDPMIGNDARLGLAIRQVDKHFEPGFFNDADIIISNTQAAAELLKTRYPQHKGKIHAIYNGFDPETQGLRALPIPPRPFRVLMHAGSLYRVSMTAAFLEALSLAVTTGAVNPATVRLRMVGEIERYRALRESPPFRSLQEAGMLECTPTHVPVAEARRMMAEADYQVAIDRYRDGGIIQLPAKTFEYVQIGRPVLAVTGSGSPMEYALRTSGIRHVCLYPEQDSPAAMAKKITEFLEFPTDPMPVTSAYEDEFGAYGQTRRLAGFFDRLLDEG
jgi:hypothetical protein